MSNEKENKQRGYRVRSAKKKIERSTAGNPPSKKPNKEKEPNDSICRKLTKIVQKQGPMDAADSRLMDALTDSEAMHILKTAGSVAKFVSQYCSTIKKEDGKLKYKPPVDLGPPLDKAKVEKMGNMHCKLMEILEKDNNVINNIKGHYSNAISERIYLHIPPTQREETEKQIYELLDTEDESNIGSFINFQDHKELVVIPQRVNGILPFIAIGSRIIRGQNFKNMKLVQEDSLWDKQIFQRLCAESYGTLGCFALNSKKTEAFAITAKHVVGSNSGCTNVISITMNDNIVEKNESIVKEDITISMKECTYITSKFKGEKCVNQHKDEYVDIAYVGPFSPCFISNHEDFEEQLAHKINIYQPRRENWDHTTVKIVGATSGLQKGRIVCSGITVKVNGLNGTAFLVASCDKGLTFSKPGDSGSVVFLDDDDENKKGLQALGVIIGENKKKYKIGETVYSNLTACTYIDVGMEVLNKIYGGQLELYDYTYRPKCRLKQDHIIMMS